MFENWFGMTDEQAMWRVQVHDDGQAFAQLVTRWEGPIQRLCVRMLNDEHKAEDLTQEAFAKVYAKRKEFHHGSKFSTFLWRVATNLCLDELRRLKRRKEIAIRAALGDEGFASYCRGQVLKYCWRGPHKGNPVEDYKKAGFYLERLIAGSEKP